MKSFKKIYKDVIYVSRITKTNNKKLIIFSAVLLAQITALADILLILFFSAIITNTFDQDNFFTPFVETGLNYNFLLPIIVIVRFLCIYLQSMTLKKLELNVQENLKLFLLTEVFEKREIIQLLMHIFI